MPKVTRLATWQNRFASGAGLCFRSIRRAKATTPASAAEHASNKKSESAYLGTADSRRTLLRQSMRTETKFYLAFGLAGIAIASMVRTLSEASPKLKSKPTEE